MLELVVADLDGLEEDFSARENPIDRYPFGRLAPKGETVAPETHEEPGEDDAENSVSVGGHRK
ncbi:hypothetical protein [Amycolatopsis anabasis]|uniref:hypothetical protein n=1 Tax=Amycolatopsis anabasis TaxID=1840409 RepID=UPI00131C4CCA|nr:hypothetical protein [Amycolatopsis anabasis]